MIRFEPVLGYGKLNIQISYINVKIIFSLFEVVLQGDAFSLQDHSPLPSIASGSQVRYLRNRTVKSVLERYSLYTNTCLSYW